MASTVSNNEIKMTRGDTLIVPIDIRVNGQPYTPTSGDSIRFALKTPRMTSGNKQFVDKEPLLIKQVPTTTMMLRIEPEDTKPLDFGEYVYDLQITFADGQVATFIETSKFTLKPEVD